MSVPPHPLLAKILQVIDPLVREGVRHDYLTARARPPKQLAREAQWVFAGHRAAGKSSVLRLLTSVCTRPAYDLDVELERRARRSLREWVQVDQPGFRAAERETFTQLPEGSMISVGGGFLSLHADLLTQTEVILVPITFDTYRARLTPRVRPDRQAGTDGAAAASQRPRLRPELSLEEELRVVFHEREAAHARVATRPLGEALALILPGARR